MTTHQPNLAALQDCVARLAYMAAQRPPRGEQLRLQRLAKIAAHIDRNFANPALCADGVARSLGLSVRNLHLALAPDGESFTQRLQRRRLAACVGLLDGGETIADIAFACGFNSLSSFYRSFRRRLNGRPRSKKSSVETTAPAQPTG